MNPLVLFIRVSVYLLILLVLLILLFIILKRTHSHFRDKRFRIRYQQVEAELLNIIAKPDEEATAGLAVKYAKYHDVLTLILLNYSKILSGPVREQLRIIFTVALEKRSMGDLASRRAMRRLRATRLLGFFIDPLKIDSMLKLLKDKPLVRLAAVQALSQLSTPETPDLVFQAFESDPSPNINSYMIIFLSLGGRVELNIRSALRKPLTEEKISLLIELAGAIPLRALYRDILAFVDHPSKEIRIKVVRALGGLLIPESAPVLIRLASDEAWEVQAQAVKSLGKLKNPGALEILTKSFFSENWYVRFNARSGLMNLGEDGIKQLDAISRQTDDSYAAAMATMALHDLTLSCEQTNT